MQQGLVFTRSRHSALDLPIRAFEGGTAGHVGIYLGDEVIDSSWMQGGVRSHTWEQFLDGRIEVDRIPVVLPDPERAEAWLRAQIGKPYDWTAIVGFVLWRDWSDDGWWYCSELGAGWMLAGGETLADRHRRFGVRLLREAAHGRRMGRAITLNPDRYAHGQ